MATIVDPANETRNNTSRHLSRLKVIGAVLTIGGIALFVFLVYSVGFDDIYQGVVRFGLAGFGVILLIYFIRLLTRTMAWKLSVHRPYSLKMKDAIPAVVIGEALSSAIPLGILVSGTAKAVAVRKHVPLVAGLSSVATENLFYSLVTSLFLIAGGIVLLHGFTIEESLALSIGLLIAFVTICILLGILMIIRQWHFASVTCNWVYDRGFLRSVLENGRADVRRFEDLIYDFYRSHRSRFLPILLLEIAYFVGGVAEVWFILSRLVDPYPGVTASFLLESINRLIIFLFKLIPFVIGVDEAGAQFISQTLALAGGVGITLAIIRKGRVLFWASIGFILVIKRGLSIREIADAQTALDTAHGPRPDL